MNKKRVFAVASLLIILATAVPVMATPLGLGVSLSRPATAPALPAPYYTPGLPAYFTPANLVTTFTAPMTIDFTGTVTTSVYKNTVGGYTFAYVFRNSGTAPGTPELIRATFSPAEWGSISISDAGSDASGVSTAGSNAPIWTDGAPNVIARTVGADGGYPYFQWRFNDQGTSIQSGNRSAVVWLETTTLNFTTSNVGLLDGGKVGKAEVLVVPAPAAVVLGILGLGTVGWLRRRLA